MSRYVIAERTFDGFTYRIRTALDLPDAEHVHLTRLPDGSYKAWPMRAYRPTVFNDMWIDDAPTGGDA